MTRAPSKPLVLVALLMASFVINLDTTLVNVALPTLTRELGATTAQLQWVVDAYNLVFAALLLTFGSLSDRFGRKGMLMAGLLVFGLASFAGGYATSPAELIAARAVMGLGAAMTFPATLSLLTGVFTSRKERALSIGLWGATAGMAIALGPIVGGFLLERYSWSSIFYTLGPVSLAVIALAARFVPGSKNPVPHGLDFPGLILSGGFMGLLIYTIIEAPGRGWTSAASLLGFAGAAVLLIAFIAGERRADQPMLDVRLFANMRFSAASASVTVAFFTLSGFIFLMTQYFQFVRTYSPLSAGVHLLPVAISVAVGSTAGTRLAVRLGGLLLLGRRRHHAHLQLRDHRRPDGRLRPGHGPDVRARDRVDHGGRLGPPGRRRLRRERLDPPAWRHPRGGRHRQRLRLPVRLAACHLPSRDVAAHLDEPRPPVHRSSVRCFRPARRSRPHRRGRRRPPGRHQRLRPRPQRRVRRRRSRRTRRRAARRRIPARPALADART